MTKDRIAAAQLSIQRAQAAIEAGEYLVAADMQQWGPKDQEVASPLLPAKRRTGGGRKRSDEGRNRRERPAIARFSIGELLRRRFSPTDFPDDNQPAGHWPPMSE